MNELHYQDFVRLLLEKNQKILQVQQLLHQWNEFVARTILKLLRGFGFTMDMIQSHDNSFALSLFTHADLQVTSPDGLEMLLLPCQQNLQPGYRDSYSDDYKFLDMLYFLGSWTHVVVFERASLPQLSWSGHGECAIRSPSESGLSRDTINLSYNLGHRIRRLRRSGLIHKGDDNFLSVTAYRHDREFSMDRSEALRWKRQSVLLASHAFPLERHLEPL